MGERRTVLVLGGGVGGVVAATRLRQRLPRHHRVILVDRETKHLFQPSLLWLAVGRRDPDAIQRPLAGLRRRGIEVITGEISELDPEARRVRVGDRELVGDAVIVALGTAQAPERVPGLSAGGHNLYSLEGAAGARDALGGLVRGRVVLLTAEPLYKCPAAPYEAAMLVADHLRLRGRMGVEVELFTAEPGPMGTAGPEVSAGVRAMVEARGIGYHPDHPVETVDPPERTIRFRNGTSTGYDVLLYVPPHRVPDVVVRSGLAAEGGWIPVDSGTLETRVPEVFAVGDATGIPIPSGRSLPKAGVFAHQQAEVVARNLAARWSGDIGGDRFDGTGACFIETGGGKAGYGSGDFYASPAPQMRLHPPARRWHWGKVLFEKHWFWKWL